MEIDYADRFWSKVLADGTGCWIWQAYVDTDGYGRFWIDGSTHRAHRVAYELVKGPIPEGLQLDHLCRVTTCVNPPHLEAVTGRENVLRGETLAAANAAKTHCANGHPYSAENTRYEDRGERACRTCARARSRSHYQRHLAAAH